jgi:hypothetical protein
MFKMIIILDNRFRPIKIVFILELIIQLSEYGKLKTSRLMTHDIL